MVVKLLIVWFLGVVAFFILWAILAKVIRRISEKKEHGKAITDNTDDTPPTSKAS